MTSDQNVFNYYFGSTTRLRCRLTELVVIGIVFNQMFMNYRILNYGPCPIVPLNLLQEEKKERKIMRPPKLHGGEGQPLELAQAKIDNAGGNAETKSPFIPIDVVSQGRVQAQAIELPSFATEPLLDSLCATNPDIVEDQFCKKKYTKCLEHEQVVNKIANMTSSHDEKGCKLLWFAGFHEDKDACKGNQTYKSRYGVALNSAIVNADESLQPVLILGRLGQDTTGNSSTTTKLSKFGRWAEERGAKVIVSRYHRQALWKRFQN
mmetsp:Transcript_42575/g.88679  ORF Transcript_42575/g.88679 Transcript_42575/m.88679 type:complete len:264 (+) Transcript_42575:66-857(+)